MKIFLCFPRYTIQIILTQKDEWRIEVNYEQKIYHIYRTLLQLGFLYEKMHRFSSGC